MPALAVLCRRSTGDPSSNLADGRSLKRWFESGRFAKMRPPPDETSAARNQHRTTKMPGEDQRPPVPRQPAELGEMPNRKHKILHSSSGPDEDNKPHLATGNQSASQETRANKKKRPRNKCEILGKALAGNEALKSRRDKSGPPRHDKGEDTCPEGNDPQSTADEVARPYTGIQK